METEPIRLEPAMLEDVDLLIQELETQFKDQKMVTVPTDPGTSGCTTVANCTGTCTCPCSSG